MSGTKFEQQLEARQAISDFLKKNGMTSLGNIQKNLEKSGIFVTRSTIGRLVREFGYDKKPTAWVKVA